MNKIEATISRYIKLRSQIRKMEREHKEKLAPFKAELERIESKFLELSERTGVNSFATDSGTAYRKERTRTNAKDWQMIEGFILDTKEIWILTRRLCNDRLQALRNNDIIVPGVEYSSEYVMTFNSPKGTDDE